MRGPAINKPCGIQSTAVNLVTKLVFSVVILLTAPQLVWSQLIELDDRIHGKGSITLDLISGKQWLDVNLSEGLSYWDVVDQYRVGGKFEGFRHATEAELLELFANAGIENVNEYGASSYSAAQEFIWLLTGPQMFGNEIYGFLADSADWELQLVGAIEDGIIADGGYCPCSALLATTTMVLENYIAHEGVGHWLVRKSLIEKDHPSYGSGSITFDSESGLEWLDVPLSQGLSYDQMARQFSAGGRFEGFRHATEEELFELFEHAGIENVNNGEPCDYSAADRLVALVGSTDVDGSALGFISENDRPAMNRQMGFVGAIRRFVSAYGYRATGVEEAYHRAPPSYIWYEATTTLLREKDRRHSNVGHWLVRRSRRF